MGQTASELRNQLSEQRDHLSRDLDAIGDRVSPHRIVERRKAAVRDRVTGVRVRLMGMAEDTTGMAQESAHRLMDAGASSMSTVGDATTTASVLGRASKLQRPAWPGSGPS